jgi:hypothetical protein
MKTFICAALLALLAACGGGDADDETPAQPRPSVDCKKDPMLCF